MGEFVEGHFHCDITCGSRAGGKLCATEKFDYNNRLDRWTEKHDGPLAFSESGNMLAWAANDPRKFWEAADKFERANGTLYFNDEFAIPLDLATRDQQLAVAREYVSRLIGDKHPYTLTMHDNKGNPHCDLQWSSSTLDGIERGPEIFFKRANGKNPERGGCRKVDYDRDWIIAARALWAEVANKHLEAVGSNVRIDHRSYAERGIDKVPGIHLGRKAHRLEKAGKATMRSVRNKERAHLNASLQEVQSKTKPKEKHNEQHHGRNGKPHQHTTRQHRSGTRAAPERAFTAWLDRAEDRPGLRSSRRAGPDGMPVLREQGVGAGQQKARDAVLQRAVPGLGGRDRGLHGVSGGGIYAVEPLDRRQIYKARILQQQYQQEIQTALAARLAYVDRQPDRIVITLKGGGSVTDHGDRMLTKAGRDQEILAALALAKAKGWKQINITGSESFKARAYVEAVRAGLAVVGYEPAPELRAQLAKEKIMTDQAGAGGMMALTPDVTAGQQALPASRWLDPLRAARERLEVERKAAKEKLATLRETDIKKMEQELAVALGGTRYLEARRKFKEADAAAKDAGALTRKRAEAKKEEAWQAFLALHSKVLTEPGAAKQLADADRKNQEREQLTAALIHMQLGIGEIEYLEREIQKGSDPEAEFRQAWTRRKRQPLKPWQELAIAPVFVAEATQERARLQAEADAANQVEQIQRNEQIQREIEAQQQADAIDDQLGKPGLTTEQEEALERQLRYYLALADGHDEEEAKERAAKKDDALRL